MGRVGGAVAQVRPAGLTAALAGALIFVGFWLTGVLSQGPHLSSYSNLVTVLKPEEWPQPCSTGQGPKVLTCAASAPCHLSAEPLHRML